MIYYLLSWGSEWVQDEHLPKNDFKDIPKWIKEALYETIRLDNPNTEIEIYANKPLMKTSHIRLNADNIKETLFSIVWKIHITEPTTKEANKWTVTTYTVYVTNPDEKELMVYRDNSIWENENNNWIKTKDTNEQKVVSFANKPILKELF